FPFFRQAVSAADDEDQVFRLIDQLGESGGVQGTGSWVQKDFHGRWMFRPRIETHRDLAHFAFGEARGALDVLFGHRVGVRVAGFAEVVEKDFHLAADARRRTRIQMRLKNGMPSRDSADSTLSPIATRSPVTRAVRRLPSSSVTITS